MQPIIEGISEKYPYLLIPLGVAIMILYGVKGLYALRGSYALRRKDFIEHWDKGRINDNVWLEMVVRQVVGKYLPADVIRSLILKPDCARGLSDIASAWKFLEYRDGRVKWRDKWTSTRKARRRLVLGTGAIYFFTALKALLLGIGATNGDLSAVEWLWLFNLTVIALFSLSFSIELDAASKAVPQHLDLN
jgi:hypothetical protein